MEAKKKKGGRYLLLLLLAMRVNKVRHRLILTVACLESGCLLISQAANALPALPFNRPAANNTLGPPTLLHLAEVISIPPPQGSSLGFILR